ncbi:MAG TPA: class I SAM-dependent methyltransferase [Anaerovoracaceae bacterium]|nr:class I SAM-dependent methyltransferase [Anaerovoracaceae bacterium]
MNYRELFRVEGLPVFQNKMFPDRESAINCSKGDVVLVQDMDTGLIFNAAFEPDLLQYDEDYQNEQAHSLIFREHLSSVKDIIQGHFGNKSIIEVGCGKGYFLEYLLALGYNIIGLDPAYEGDNPRVVKACFAPDLGMKADCIVLRHVLEHIKNPYQFLRQIADANGNQGKIYIEVPCFDWICDHCAWFDIFYEHVNYFRESDFSGLFEEIYESGHVFGGQYLYLVANLASLVPPEGNAVNPFTFPIDFLDKIQRYSARANSRKIAVWGGASKGVIFSFYMKKQGVDVDVIIDINPDKQGKYIASTGTKVLSPSEAMSLLSPGDDIFVMNSNYLEEIKQLSHNQFNYLRVDQDEF